MKKLSLYGAIVTVIGLALVMFAMTVSENPFDVGEARVEKIYTFDAGDVNGDINISEKHADIYISLSDDDKVHLKTFENDDEYYEISNKLDLDIVYMRDYEWFQKIIDLSFLGEKFRYTLELSLPEELITGIEIESVNCNSYVDGITVRSLDISKTNGTANVNKVNSLEDMDIDTVNGDIELNHVTAVENMEIYSTNGDVKLDVVDFGHRGLVETTNGNISADLNDNGDNYTFDISTVNGKINIEYGNVDQEGKSISFGSGEKKFDVKTTNGKVEVTCKH